MTNHDPDAPIGSRAEEQLRRTFGALRTLYSELSSVHVILDSCAEEPVQADDAGSVIEGIARCVHEAQRAWHDVAPTVWLDTRIHKYAFASELQSLSDELRDGSALELTTPRHIAEMRTRIETWMDRIDAGYERFCGLHPSVR